ncbi:MAG: hypothetical protein M3440_01795 [Chloroflexota bacterium]|nr:hypothetical protein [Chloroflexota bacterium]
MIETRRHMIHSNHESIQRTIAVLNNMEQSFLSDLREVDSERRAKHSAALQEARDQCLECVVTLAMLLRYSGLSNDEILKMADQIDRDASVLAAMRDDEP